MQLSQIDKDGKLLWEKTYSRAEIDQLSNLVATADGGALLAEITQATNKTKSAPPAWDMYLVRVDGDGNKLWEKTYDESGQNGILNLVLTPDGGALLVGGQWSTKTESDIVLLRVDKTGNELWKKTYNSASRQHVSQIILTPDGGALLGGQTQISLQYSTMFLMRVDATGNKLWERRYDKDGRAIYGAALAPNGGAWLAGAPKGNIPHGILIAIDADGNKLWDKTYPSFFTGINHIARLPDGGALIGGETRHKTTGNWDFHLMRLDVDGNQIWEKSYGEPNAQDQISHLELASDGQVLFAGETKTEINENIMSHRRIK